MNDDGPSEITVRKLTYHIPVTLLGLDELGRQQYRCPNPGCGDTAYIDADGRGMCPTDQAMRAFLDQGWSALQTDYEQWRP